MIASSQRRGVVESSGRAIAAWVALAVLMALGSALILYFGRGLTFFRDEWTFVIYRDGHDLPNFLASYAGHLLFWPTAFYVVLFKAVGLDHYELYRLASLPLHLACVLFVFLLARRRVGSVVALAPATVLLFLGSAWMDLLWPFQIAFTGAVASGLAALLLLDRDDLTGDALAGLLLLVAIGWSGAALPFLAGVAAGLLVRRRFWRRLWVVAIPAAAYLLWNAKYQDQHIDYGSTLPHVPEYALKMAGAGVAGITGCSQALGGWLALALGVLTAVRLWQLRRSSPLAWEALAMELGYWLLTAIARAQENDPAANRYVYSTVVFLLLLLVGLAPKAVPGRAVTAVVLVLAALTLLSNIGALEEGREDLVFTSNVTSAELGALELARESVSPEFAPELNGFVNAVPSAAFFAATARYGSTPADSPEQIAASPEYARRRADTTSLGALAVQLRPVPGRLQAAADPPALQVRSGSVEAGPAGCLTLAGPGRLEAAGQMPAGGVRIESGAAPTAVGLRRFAASFHQLRQPVPAGQARVLTVPSDLESKRPWRLWVGAEGGRIRVCDLASGSSASPSE